MRCLLTLVGLALPTGFASRSDLEAHIQGGRMRSLSMILWLSLAGIVSAQTSGEITGEVHDQSGAAAPNATVTVTNTGTNASRSTTTNDAGIYSVPSLVPGNYQVRVALQGFQPVVRTGVELQVQQTA